MLLNEIKICGYQVERLEQEKLSNLSREILFYLCL